MSDESQAPANCCMNNATNSAADSGHREDLLAGGDDVTTCPVMVGNLVSKKAAEAQGLFRDHEGQRYWFCCAGCGPTFDSDPAKYTATMA